MQRRERGMVDERKSRRMRGWNDCTHKEGKRWENDSREGVRMPLWAVKETTRAPVQSPLSD